MFIRPHRSSALVLLGATVLAGLGACERFTLAPRGSIEDLDVGAPPFHGGGGATVGSSTGTGMPCSDENACGSCATCIDRVCAPVTVGIPCDGGMCDGSGRCATGTVTWARSFGQPAGATVGQDVVVDKSGTVLVTGYYIGSSATSIDMDGHAIGAMSQDGDANIFAVAVDADDGAVAWAQDIGSGLDNSGQFSEGLAADVGGGAWLGGHFAGSFSLGAWPQMTSNAGNDPLVGRIAATGEGTAAWSHGDIAVQEVWALSGRSTGGVVGTGVNAGSVTGGSTVHVSANGQPSAFAVAVDTVGAALWVAGLEHSGSDRSGGHAVAVGDDEVWIGGTYRGTGSWPGAGTLPFSGATENAFLARVDADTGEATALVGWGNEDGDQRIGGIALSGASLVVTGAHTASFTANGQRIEGMGPYVAWLDLDGQVMSIHTFATNVPVSVHDVAVDPAGNAVVVGATSGAGALLLGTFIVETEGVAGFIAKIAPGGEVLWADATPGALGGIRGVAATHDAIFVTGFSDDAAFGAPSATGTYDAFIARLAP